MCYDMIYTKHLIRLTFRNIQEKGCSLKVLLRESIDILTCAGIQTRCNDSTAPLQLPACKI